MKPLLYSHFFPPSRSGIETTVLHSVGDVAGHSATDGGCEFEAPKLRKVITTIVGPGAMGEGYGVSACRRSPNA